MYRSLTLVSSRFTVFLNVSGVYVWGRVSSIVQSCYVHQVHVTLSVDTHETDTLNLFY